MRTRLPVALATLALITSLPGCGGSSDNGDEAAARKSVAEHAALAHRLDRLRGELHHRRLLLKAKREQAAREIAHERRQTVEHSSADVSSFDQLAASLSGEVGAVIGPPGSSEAVSFGSLQSGSAWSTSKVPISLRVLEDAGGPSGLSSAQAEEMRSALTLSDNEAAAALFGDLERSHGGLVGASAAVGEVLREGGDSSTQISTQGRGEFSTYGQTEWSLANQQRFMSSLAANCVGGSESSDYVLGLMGEVSSDTWGLGSAGLPARWKGGWGPGVDGGYLVRQMGILYVGDKEAVVTLAALPADGQFASGESMATSVAQWLAKQAPRYAATPSGC
ncbi:MAG TPA: hypothetical protein VLK89_03935 [Solirubrobacterales bacterium]|nr:hypothetical protein [Solirubrobacterales bacterium]